MNKQRRNKGGNKRRNNHHNNNHSIGTRSKKPTDCRDHSEGQADVVSICELHKTFFCAMTEGGVTPESNCCQVGQPSYLLLPSVFIQSSMQVSSGHNLVADK